MFLLSWLFITGNIDAPSIWWVDVFFSQKAKLQLPPKRIPKEHEDELGNTYGKYLLVLKL